MAIVVVDVTGGRILGASSAAEELVGTPLPPTLSDLVEAGAISRPDLGRLERRMRTSEAWSDELRVHRRGRDPLALHLEVIVHHREALGASAAIVTIWPADREAVASPAGERTDIWAVYDDGLRMIAADPAFADLGIDPVSQLGAMAWMYAHPDDIPGPQRLVAELVAGRLRTTRYSVRLRGRTGGWLDADVEVRRLVAADGSLLVVIARYVDHRRRAIPVGALTASQLRAVDGLFEGLRVAQIAERDSVAVKTVRNHLAAAYARLEVTGQVELLRTYHPPAGPSGG